VLLWSSDLRIMLAVEQRSRRRRCSRSSCLRISAMPRRTPPRLPRSRRQRSGVAKTSQQRS
jgi:hypothetical protein